MKQTYTLKSEKTTIKIAEKNKATLSSENNNGEYSKYSSKIFDKI